MNFINLDLRRIFIASLGFSLRLLQRLIDFKGRLKRLISSFFAISVELELRRLATLVLGLQKANPRLPRGKLNIGILLPNLRTGGAERVMLSLSSALSDQGNRVFLILMTAEGELLKLVDKRVTVVNLECRRLFSLPFKLPFVLNRLCIDGLVSNFWTLNVCAVIARVFRCRMRLLLWEHGVPLTEINGRNKFYAPLVSIAYPFATHICAVSSEVKRQVDRRSIFREIKASVVAIPVSPPRKQKNFYRRTRLITRLIWVGRLERAKNPQLALRILKLLVQVRPFDLVFIGDGILRSDLERLVDELKLKSHVSFKGYVPDVYPYMGSSDALLITSNSEGLPAVLIEALHLNLTIFSTKCSYDVQQLIVSLGIGTVSPCNNEELMAKNILTYHRQNKPHENIEAILARFSPDSVARSTLGLLRLNS